MEPASIKIFLIKGGPSSLRTAEISNWSGKAIACPRSELADLLAREEMTFPGVYLLSGIDPEIGDPALYIGEGESVKSRLRGHRDKDFWSNAVIFVSKDENLTKSHIKFLEGKLIDLALKSGRAKVMNAVSSRSKLPEADAAEMEVFLDKIIQLLPVLGNELMKPLEGYKSKDKEVLFCKIKGLVAKGKRTPNGFIVYKQSQAVYEHRPSAKWSRKRREDLIQSGVLRKAKGHYVFSRDFEFGSPSTAGAVIRGGATNGLTAWKNDQGLSLREIEMDI